MSGFGLGSLVSAGLNLPETLLFGSDPLILDTIVFADFEIPERINWGGTQKIVSHLLPGGERVFDIMGRDEEPIAWSGIFLGRQAIPDAIALDVLRSRGKVVQLNWGTLSYTVVVESFSAEYRLKFHIPYKISCKILRDNSAPLPNDTVTPEQSVANDVTSATQATPGDAPANAVTKTTAETGPGTTVTKTYQPIDQVSPTTANATEQLRVTPSPAGSNELDPFVQMVDLGPQASIVPTSAAPATTLPAAMSNAGTASDALATNNFLTGGASGIFGP